MNEELNREGLLEDENRIQGTIDGGINIEATMSNNNALSGNLDVSPSPSSSSTDVQVNGTSITNNNIANLLTNGEYSSSNKIATMSDLEGKEDKITYTRIPYQQETINIWELEDGGYIFGDGQAVKLFENNIEGSTQSNTITMSDFIFTDYLVKSSVTQDDTTMITYRVERNKLIMVAGNTVILGDFNMGLYFQNVTDVSINNVSLLSYGGAVNLATEGEYNANSNKLVTKSYVDNLFNSIVNRNNN